MEQSDLVQKLNNMTVSSALMMSLLFGGFYYLAMYNDGSKIVSNTQKVRAEIQVETNKKSKTENILKEADSVKAEVSMLAEKFQIASAKLPSEVKSQEFIDTIRSLVQNSGCRIVNIRALEVEKKPLYDEYPVSVEIRGTFSNLLIFLFYVATVERITNVTEFNVGNLDSVAQGGVVKFVGTLVSYKFKAPEVQPVKTPKKTSNKKGVGA